jgi:CheY-like chemotaxis protein
MKLTTPKFNCIVVIDDDPIAAFINVSLLEEMQIAERIESVENATLGLEILTLQHPDVVLLDIQMPETDGFELMEQIQRMATPGKTIYVAVSSHFSERDLRKLKLLGVNHFITKPLTKEKVFLCLESVTSFCTQ